MELEKKTKKIFAVTGKGDAVETVLNTISGFKAMSLIRGQVYLEEINTVFKNNKSIVCRKENIPQCLMIGMDVICIYATDSVMPVLGAKNIINTNQNIQVQFMQIAEKYSVDIGDHSSNATVQGPKKSDCIFCMLMKGIMEPQRPILYESDNFIVVPGNGAFMEGYIMILPKAHVMSCAELDISQRKEMLEVISDVKDILGSIYKSNILVWENGSGSSGKGKPKTSIVHAHIHACPSKLNILETTKVTGVPVNKICIENLANYSENSYLLICDYDDQWYISYDSELYIPRQFIRQLIALENNIAGELWNWREYPFWEEMNKNGYDFLKYVSENWNNLSSRIKERTEKFVL